MNAIDTVEILLVEDSDEIAELTRRVLKKINLHANIVWVNDGDLAIDFLLRQGKFAEPHRNSSAHGAAGSASADVGRP